MSDNTRPYQSAVILPVGEERIWNSATGPAAPGQTPHVHSPASEARLLCTHIFVENSPEPGPGVSFVPRAAGAKEKPREMCSSAPFLSSVPPTVSVSAQCTSAAPSLAQQVVCGARKRLLYSTHGLPHSSIFFQLSVSSLPGSEPGPQWKTATWRASSAVACRNLISSHLNVRLMTRQTGVGNKFLIHIGRPKDFFPPILVTLQKEEQSFSSYNFLSVLNSFAVVAKTSDGSVASSVLCLWHTIYWSPEDWIF